MTFDVSSLGPLAGSLARAGLPALCTVLGAVLPPPWNFLAGGAFQLVAKAMDVDPASPDAPAQVQAKVDADPTAAAAKLQSIEAEHRDAAEAANRELELRLADVQDARAAEVEYVKAGSPIQWGPVAISLIIVLGYAAACLVPIPPGAQNAGMYETIKLLVVMVASFWLGSSKGSADKTSALVEIARQPQVIQGPGSHVSGGVAPSGAARRR